MENKVLIPLQIAHVNQYTTDINGKSQWEVQENKTNNILAILPKELTDSQMFSVLKFARKFELLAFNIGMDNMKEVLTISFNTEKSKLLRVIKELEIANGKLANKLEKFIGE